MPYKLFSDQNVFLLRCSALGQLFLPSSTWRDLSPATSTSSESLPSTMRVTQTPWRPTKPSLLRIPSVSISPTGRFSLMCLLYFPFMCRLPFTFLVHSHIITFVFPSRCSHCSWPPRNHRLRQQVRGPEVDCA